MLLYSRRIPRGRIGLVCYNIDYGIIRAVGVVVVAYPMEGFGRILASIP